MRIVEAAGPADFLARSTPLLLESEAENNLLFSGALAIARGATTPGAPRIGYHLVEFEGEASCAALEVGEKLLLSIDRNGAAAELGKNLADRSFKKVLGPNASVTSFSAGHGQMPIHERTQAALRIDRAPKTAQASGLMRVANERDVPLLLKWSLAFGADSEAPVAAESSEVLRHTINNRQLFLWEDPKPVAMAGFGGLTPSGVRVNMVYTEPRSRSKGYARSLVGSLTHKLLSSGQHKSCFLFVDTGNQAALAVYESLGFKPAGRLTELSF